jgi:hypothetical protein
MWSPLKFADAVRKHWGGIVTSGVIIGALGIWQSTGHIVNPRVYWAIALLGLIFATYRTWDDQYLQFETRDKEARKKEEELQGKLDELKRWSFEVEFLKASRSVYIHENGNSPFVALFISALVHNRNRESTTVYARSVSVKLKDEIDRNFQGASIIPGGSFSFDSPEEYGRYDVAGSSSVELLFCTKRYNPPKIDEYIQDVPLIVTLELGETFSEGRTLTGPLVLDGITRQ